MKLSKLFEKIEYKCLNGDSETEVQDIVYDSRKAAPGTVFVCLTGAELDGHRYIGDAAAKGVSAIVVEKECEVPEGMTVIRVKDTRTALACMSAALFGYPADRLTMIGITGTKGKTTTAFMIKSILEKAGKKVGMIGTVGAFINGVHTETKNTTPESYELHKFFHAMVESGCEYGIMEVSSQALKTNRTAGISYHYGIYTNLQPDHIGGNEHADFEEYKYCKSLMFRQTKTGIFNLDDEHAMTMQKAGSGIAYTYGFSDEANVKGREVNYLVEPGFIGIQFDTEGLINDSFKVNTPGKFSSYNAMAAITFARLEGIPVNFIKEALHGITVRGRVESIKVSDRFNLLIDYAHNAMSMQSILSTIREYNPKRVVSVFGCGGNRSRLRRFEMGEISGNLADLSILTSDNSRFEETEDIINDILTGINKTDGTYIVIPDRKDAIRYSIEHAEDGDIVLLLGKGHEDYQEMKGVRYPFDERVVIQEILEDLYRNQ